MGRSRSVTFQGPAGRIEGILQEIEEGPPARVAIVCHPHPLGGGTMHTKVVHRAARALQLSGHRVLRFNFRGVGASEGTHGQGIGEQDDVRAALDWLDDLRPGLPATLAGFSFGSWVGLKVGAADPRADALIGIAPPANLFDYGFLEGCGKEKLFVHGTADTIAPLAAFERIFAGIAPPKKLVRIEGGSLLLAEHLDQVEAVLAEFARGLTSGAR
jgi:alpha/beta superfamily hydrolase